MQLSTQPHTWQKRRPIRNTSQWSVTLFTSWRCAQPFSSTLYCTTLHLCIDCPMIYFEVAAQSTLSLSCGCCYNGFRQQSWGCILTVQTHFLHVSFWKMRSEFVGLVAVFFVNQDLWSWMLAILQNIMPSLLIHLRHTLTNSLFGLGHDCWFPSKCWAVVSRWAEAEISLQSPCYGVICLADQYQSSLGYAALYPLLEYPVSSMLVWCLFNGVPWWTMLSQWSSALDNFTVCQHQDLTLVK